MTISAFAFVNVTTVGVTAILIPWLVRVHLTQSATVYGLLTSAAGVGALVAALLFARRSRWHRRGLLAYLAIVVAGGALASMAAFTQVGALALCMVMSGAGLALFGLIWEGSLQELVPTEAYGRVSSLDLLGSYALLPVGNLLTGWLAGTIGGVQTMVAEGVATLVIALLMLLVPAIRRFQ